MKTKFGLGLYGIFKDMVVKYHVMNVDKNGDTFEFDAALTLKDWTDILMKKSKYEFVGKNMIVMYS